MTDRPVLSLILCSRNDAYMGNSRWRLESALNYAARRITDLGAEAEVEVVVTDWGSDVPLSRVLALEPEAARLVSFVWVPPLVARGRQRDSPFPEVLALNTAARRSHGRFIGRIDQDTLIGERFLRLFLDWARGGWHGDAPLSDTLLFANRRSLPYRLAVRCPPLESLEQFIRQFHGRLAVETSRPGEEFYGSDVGVWLVSRERWEECRGYDERLIYMNDMELDMAVRLMTKFPMVDLGQLTAYDFYHLDHYHPRGSRSSATHRRVNQWALKGGREALRTLPLNGEDWGLADEPLEIQRAAGVPSQRRRGSMPLTLRATPLAVYTAARMAGDNLGYRIVGRWVKRGRTAWLHIRQQPVREWPPRLRDLWNQRGSTKAG